MKALSDNTIYFVRQDADYSCADSLKLFLQVYLEVLFQKLLVMNLGLLREKSSICVGFNCGAS